MWMCAGLDTDVAMAIGKKGKMSAIHFSLHRIYRIMERDGKIDLPLQGVANSRSAT